MTLAPERPTATEAEPSPRREMAPALAEGCELIGEYEGSGFKEPPSLVRRVDGQVIQLPGLLYLVARKADGRRTYEQIAQEITREIERGVDADSVRFLVEEKLRPLGIMAAADGTSPDLEKADPFLGFKFRVSVVSEAMSNRLGMLCTPLFFPLVVVASLVALVAVDLWLFLEHGVAQSLRESIYHPALFLPFLFAVMLSAAFHEMGHAAACRYGGGRPGKMGCGIYMVWPAFYTDVTDAYRLGKRARLRTDLGGVYFNVIIVLVTVGAYAMTGFEPLLMLAVFQHLEIAHQLLPVVRLDGYYIIADATGVPDLFSRIGPILRSMVPWKKTDERVLVLKRWVRVAVTAWVLVVVPLLLFELFIVLLHLPRMMGTAWDSASKMFQTAQDSFGSGNVLGGISSVLQIIVLAIPMTGILLLLTKTGGRGARWIWRRTDGRPVRRVLTVAAVCTIVGFLLFSWLSPKNYTPIRPGEKGTLIEGVRAVRSLPDLPSETAPTPSERSEEVEEEEDTETTPTTVATSTTVVEEPAVSTTVPAGPAGGTDPATTDPPVPTTAATPTTIAPAPTTTMLQTTTTVS